MTRLVNWPKPPALCGPVEETQGVVLESDSEGECLTSREPPPTPLPPGCDAEDKLAIEEASRGLLAEVTARDRLPPWYWPLA